jgi:hypothetical protein
MAPPRWRGLLAMIPTGWPAIRANTVTMPTPNPARTSSSEPVSASVSMTGRTS